ncbi:MULTISPECIES: tetratricopeptide repeat protein [Microcystis]|uniref:Tetratricopeptide repeat protein n=1 Tax=Microcystis panniformis FACHB-1757 TaxID=1638788 RepID=A0A0K1S1B5_9CHRO|nr:MULTISPECIES: tetratricopeptide repeat protein [Microcystis]AKV67850.1 hypothetical protein VL20_2798 [Microcystis panniformis FACHB-1757]
MKISISQQFSTIVLLYYFQVRYTEAEPLHLEAINIFREGLGENHSHTQTVYRNYRGMLS